MLYGIIDRSNHTTFVELKTDAYKAQESMKAVFMERKMIVTVFPANYEYLACVLVNKALRIMSNEKRNKATEARHIPESIFTVETTLKAFKACLVPEEKGSINSQNTSPFFRMYKESGYLLSCIANYINHVEDAFIHCESGSAINLSHDMQVVTGYICRKESELSQELNDLISSAKVAIFEHLPQIAEAVKEANESEKMYSSFFNITEPGYKAINHTVYTEKNKPLPIDRNKIDVLARLKMYRTGSKTRNEELEKQIDTFINSKLSPKERTIVSLLFGENSLKECSILSGIPLSVCYELKASIAEKMIECFPDIENHTDKQKIDTFISDAKARKEARKEAKKKTDKQLNSTPKRKAYLAQKAKERRARQKAQK